MKSLLNRIISKISNDERDKHKNVFYSISIYKDARGDILIIPQAFDENGVRRDINKSIKVDSPFDVKTLGKAIKESFEIVQKEPFQHSRSAVKVYEIATGIKSWAKFSKEREFVSATYNIENGYEFSPWKRFADFSYRPYESEVIFKAVSEANAEEIGKSVVNAFDNFRQRDSQ